MASVSTANGARIQQWTCLAGQVNQAFFLGNVPISSVSQPLPQPTPAATDFKSTLKAEHSGRCVDAGTANSDGKSLYQWDCVGVKNQNFIFTAKAGGYYEIKSEYSGKCIDLYNKNTADGASLVEYTCNGGDNQLFRLEDIGGGRRKIHSKVNDKCMDVAGISLMNGAKVFLWSCWGGMNENFFVTPK